MENVMTTEQGSLTPERVRALGSRMRSLLELVGSPVGADYSLMKKEGLAGAHTLTHYRYCQAMMKARTDDGYHVTVVPDCPPVHDSPVALHSLAQLVGLKVRGIQTKGDAPGMCLWRRMDRSMGDGG